MRDWPFYTADRGTWLDFGEVSSLEEIEVGVLAKILVNDDNPRGGIPEGHYVVASGETFVFEKGVLTEIIPPEPKFGILFERKFRVQAVKKIG